MTTRTDVPQAPDAQRRWAARLACAAVLAAVLPVAPVLTLGAGARRQLPWIAAAAVLLWAVAGVATRYALAAGDGDLRDGLPAPAHPYLLMNMRSGGGKVASHDLAQRAVALGAEVVVFDGVRPCDVAALARDAVARGADLLGVAGGDGSQALVAEVAAANDLPFLVISAGTRNRFAADLGLDYEDPGRCLDALRDGVERRVDLGRLGDRPFVNDVSFGAYAAIAQEPPHGDSRARTDLDRLPHVLATRRGPRLVAVGRGWRIDRPQALLVSNNQYRTGDVTGVGRRMRLNGGRLGVFAVRVDSEVGVSGPARGRHAAGVTSRTADRLEVHSDRAVVAAGIDGEAAWVSMPVRCSIAPGALRVRLPRDRRQGVACAQAAPAWRRLWLMVLPRRPDRPLRPWHPWHLERYRPRHAWPVER